jgi:hypothetical protein
MSDATPLSPVAQLPKKVGAGRPLSDRHRRAVAAVCRTGVLTIDSVPHFGGRVAGALRFAEAPVTHNITETRT